MADGNGTSKAIGQRALSHEGGATSIEYGLMAAVLGTGILVSGSYIKTEILRMTAGDGCVWQAPEEGDAESGHRCVTSPGWSFIEQ